jgi:hypothetical protein
MELADLKFCGRAASEGHCGIIVLIFKLGRIWYVYAYVYNDVLDW